MLTAIWTGCIPTGGSSNDVSGTVHDRDFDVESGSAESNFEGGFTITLADTTEYACASESGLPNSFLTIVVANISGPMEIPASDAVVFNAFDDGIGTAEPATSGTLFIDSVDPFLGRIAGSIDATGATSAVDGYFSVEICN